jgi:uncharacterized membrane protein
MTGTLGNLFLAMLAFTGGHFLLSHPPVRSGIVNRLGERTFLGGYSLLMALFLLWAIFAYRSAPTMWLWQLGAAGRKVPLFVMPFALVLAVVGLTSRNPTAVGGELAADIRSSAKGIVTITRHPFLWGVGLWALAHLAANGDAASVILFGGMALLALCGMQAIDHKRSVRLGSAWRSFADATSLLPFAAALSGRSRIDWRGIGWVRPLVALVLYVALVHTHHRIFGGAPVL